MKETMIPPPRTDAVPRIVTIPYFPSFSDAIAQTAIETVRPIGRVGRYSIVCESRGRWAT